MGPENQHSDWKNGADTAKVNKIIVSADHLLEGEDILGNRIF